MAALGYAHAVTGRRNEAQKILHELTARAKQRQASSFHLAFIHLGLGDKDRTFALLNQVFDERANLPLILKADPFVDPLRSDPRFADLLRRMGLAP